jgi:hypothetical protein
LAGSVQGAHLSGKLVNCWVLGARLGQPGLQKANDAEQGGPRWFHAWLHHTFNVWVKFGLCH